MLTNITKTCHLWQTLGFDKRAAVRGIIECRMMTGNSRGKGNKAAKRAAHIETAQWFDTYCQLNDQDINAIYDELRTEGKIH